MPSPFLLRGNPKCRSRLLSKTAYYQKVDSHNLAVKAKTCLEKLRDQRGCTASLKRINCSTASHQHDFQERFHIEDCGRQKKVAFSETEDQFISEGMKKYEMENGLLY